MGIQELTDEPATDEYAPDALFLRRAAQSIVKQPGMANQHFRGCNHACGYGESLFEEGAVLRVCDATCMNVHSWMAFRFNGHNCGAGEYLKYGMSCRLCYTDQQAALIADQALTSSNWNSSTSKSHVTMCGTKQPPDSIDCSRACRDNTNTV